MTDRAGCSQPGCGVFGAWASYVDAEGRRWCISHYPDQRAKREAVAKGGQAAARAKLWREPLDLSTPDAQSAVLERVAAGVLAGHQHPKAGAVIVSAVMGAAKVYELANLDRRLKALEAGQ